MVAVPDRKRRSTRIPSTDKGRALPLLVAIGSGELFFSPPDESHVTSWSSAWQPAGTRLQFAPATADPLACARSAGDRSDDRLRGIVQYAPGDLAVRRMAPRVITPQRASAHETSAHRRRISPPAASAPGSAQRIRPLHRYCGSVIKWQAMTSVSAPRHQLLRR